MISDVISKSYEDLKREVEDRSWWKKFRKGCHKPAIQGRKLKRDIPIDAYELLILPHCVISIFQADHFFQSHRSANWVFLLYFVLVPQHYVAYIK